MHLQVMMVLCNCVATAIVLQQQETQNLQAYNFHGSLVITLMLPHLCFRPQNSRIINIIMSSEEAHPYTVCWTLMQAGCLLKTQRQTP